MIIHKLCAHIRKVCFSYMVRETSQSETGAWPVSFSTSDGTSDSFQRVGSFEQFGLFQPVFVSYDIVLGNLA